MTKELEDRLFALGPRWFKRDSKKSCMGRGFECGDGWFALIESLLLSIREFGSSRDPSWSSFEIRQVKEKFGKLTIYYIGGDDRLKGAIELAEWLSLRMCEKCGRPGCLRQNKKRIYKTVCTHCVVYDSKSAWTVARSIDVFDLKRSRARGHKVRGRLLLPKVSMKSKKR